MDRPLNLLIIEDEESDFLLLEQNLHKHEISATCRRVDTDADLDKALTETWDLILMDFGVPGMNFHNGLERIIASTPGTPVILVSGTVTEEMALELVHSGITDFLLKDNLKRLPVVVRRALELVEQKTARQHAEEELHEHMARLERAVQGTINVIAIMGEMRDPYTYGHERRVGDLAAAIARELGQDANQVEMIRTCGYMHDVGKIAVPAEILAKPTRLTAAEFSLVKDHAQQSYDILNRADLPCPIAEVAWQHHERLNGSGYPRGLKDEEIIPEARILSVADVVEAMASHRPYRPALGIEPALAEVERNRGTIFDAHVVDACLNLFRKKGFELPT